MLHLEESKLRVRVNKNFLHILSTCPELDPTWPRQYFPMPFPHPSKARTGCQHRTGGPEVSAQATPAIDWFLLKVATTRTLSKATLDPSLGSTGRGLARKRDLAWRLPAPPREECGSCDQASPGWAPSLPRLNVGRLSLAQLRCTSPGTWNPVPNITHLAKGLLLLEVTTQF